MQKTQTKKQESKKAEFGKVLLSFKAPEYAHHEKSAVWFIVAGIIILLLVYYGLATNGWTFSVAVLILTGTYFLFNREKPTVVPIEFSDAGVKIGKHEVLFNNLSGFWIVYDPPYVKKLYLRSASRLYPDIFVSLDNANPVRVKQLLSKHLVELKGKHEPFSDTLVRLFKL